MKSSVDRKIRYRFFCCCCCSPFQYLQSHLLLFMEVVAFVCLLATNQFRCKNSISQYMYKCVCVCVSHRNRNAYWALCERFTRLQSTNESNNKKNTLIHSLTFTLSQNYSSWATILALENEDICHRRRLPDVYAVC